MIGKIRKGRSFGGCIRYVTQKDDAEIIASEGVLLGTAEEMYAQQDNYSKQHNYLRATEQFFLTDKELKDLPADARIAVEATRCV